MNDHIHLQASDIYGAFWQSGKLTIATKNGGLVFGCPREQLAAVKALRAVGFNVDYPKLSKEQQYMKALHGIVNRRYFAGKLSTPRFYFETLGLDAEGIYNTQDRSITFCNLTFRNGLENSPRHALDLMLHEASHQFLHERIGWQPTKGIDPHDEPAWETLCLHLIPLLGLPAKSELTPYQLRHFPFALTDDSYYTKHEPRKPLYDWR